MNKALLYLSTLLVECYLSWDVDNLLANVLGVRIFGVKNDLKLDFKQYQLSYVVLNEIKSNQYCNNNIGDSETKTSIPSSTTNEEVQQLIPNESPIVESTPTTPSTYRSTLSSSEYFTPRNGLIQLPPKSKILSKHHVLYSYQ